MLFNVKPRNRPGKGAMATVETGLYEQKGSKLRTKHPELFVFLMMEQNSFPV
jgi:hypothetical protein